MAVQTWQLGRVGNWFTAANWASGSVPQEGDTVIIESGTSIIDAGDPPILGGGGHKSHGDWR
jgi:hypothetical protein